MKVSVSLGEQDLAALDRFVAEAGLESRSAGVQHAIRRLVDPELEAAYAAAFDEWAASDDAPLWDSVAGDGLDDEAR